MQMDREDDVLHGLVLPGVSVLDPHHSSHLTEMNQFWYGFHSYVTSLGNISSPCAPSSHSMSHSDVKVYSVAHAKHTHISISTAI